MTGLLTAPRILIDVDGVLNPDFRATWDGLPGDPLRASGWVIIGGFIFNERPVWLNLTHGRKLLDVAEKTGAELVWATRWHHLANQIVAPVIGLPQLPVIPFSLGMEKAEQAIPWLLGRPFVWLDDEEGVAMACDAIPGGNAVQVDSLAGLTDADLEQAVVLLGKVTA